MRACACQRWRPNGRLIAEAPGENDGARGERRAASLSEHNVMNLVQGWRAVQTGRQVTQRTSLGRIGREWRTIRRFATPSALLRAKRISPCPAVLSNSPCCLLPSALPRPASPTHRAPAPKAESRAVMGRYLSATTARSAVRRRTARPVMAAVRRRSKRWVAAPTVIAPVAAARCVLDREAGSSV